MKFDAVKGLWVGFGVLILSLIIASFLIDRNIRSIGRVVALESMGSASFGMEINVLGMGLSVLKYQESGDPSQRERVVDDAGDYARYKQTYDSIATSDHEKQLSERMNVLFAEYREVSELLMNSSDEQRTLLVQIAVAWGQIDKIIDYRLHPGNRRNYRDLANVEAANVEADVAEVATWVATYLRNPQEDTKKRLFASVSEFRANLSDLRALAPEQRRLTGEIKSIFEEAMSRVSKIIELNDIMTEKGERFIELRNQMDDILDDEIQAVVIANMIDAKAEAEQTVFYLRMASVVLLIVGMTITIVAMSFMTRRSKQLEISNRALKIEIDVREKFERNLSESRESLRALTVRLQSVRDEERMKIARKIHDELGQLTTAMIIDLFWLKKHLPSGKLADRAESMLKLSDSILETARRIASELRTGLLDEFGLSAAVEQQTEEFQRRTGIQCDLVINLNDGDLDSTSSAAGYYIFQEAMTNIARHAEATAVNIVLEENDEQVVLHIEDNGKGVSDEMLAGSRSLGVVGMRERAIMLGGDIEIGGVSGKGTRVTARIPKANPQPGDGQ